MSSGEQTPDMKPFPYQIHGELGSGPIGHVFAAMEPPSDIPLALKRVHAALGESRERRDALLSACRKIIAANSPFIDPIFHVSARMNRQYVVMPCDTGESLASSWVGTDDLSRRCAPTVALDYTSQVAASLSALHELGVVSGNLKPSNVRIRRSGDPGDHALKLVVSDVVYADMIATHKLVKQHTDTAIFAAPELFDGEYNARSDQYSLAVLSWIWLFGNSPFAPRSVASIVEQKRSVDALIEQQSKKFDPSVLRTFKRALQADPNLRFPSVGEFHNTLQDALHQVPDGIAADGTAVMPPTLSRRQFFWGAIAAAETVALLALFRPRLNALATALDDTQTAVQATTMPTIQFDLLKSLSGRHSYIEDLDWSPTGSLLAAACYDTNTYVWDTSTGDPEPTNVLSGHTGFVTSVAWDATGQRLATSSQDGTIRIWDNATHSTKLILRGHTDTVYHVDWYADGSKLISCSADQTVRIWDTRSGAELLSITPSGIEAPIRISALSPDNTVAAAGDLNGNVWVFDAQSGAEIGHFASSGNGIFALAFSPDSGTLAAGGSDRFLYLWNTRINSPIATFPRVAATTRVAASIGSVAWSHDQHTITAGAYNGVITVWPTQGPIASLGSIQVDGSLSCMRWSRQSAILAVGTSNKIVQLWQQR